MLTIESMAVAGAPGHLLAASTAAVAAAWSAWTVMTLVTTRRPDRLRGPYRPRHSPARVAALALTPLAFDPLGLLLHFLCRLTDRQVPAVSFAEAAHQLVAARMHDQFGPMPVFLARQDDGGRKRVVVEETLHPGEPPFDELPERRGDVDVPAGDVESHTLSVSSCQFPVSGRIQASSGTGSHWTLATGSW